MKALTIKEIQEKSDTELIASLYWVTVRSTKETNSLRGLTKRTIQEEERILREVIKRFNLDEQVLIDRKVLPSI
ncbi:hypothetical protein ANTHONY_273 [Bacillus phage Anthony]|uniref:Uncharacterized protein n=1 Tax=Bacillus phage Anthony TaxID=2024253 RepID=A0A223LHR6_9CAUD|nr:hypothetical protein ANTHONY_273 [Bacillus phage Anthony]